MKTQAEKLSIVLQDEKLAILFKQEVAKAQMEYRGHGKMYIRGKKVGNWIWACTQKRIASSIYDEYF